MIRLSLKRALAAALAAGWILAAGAAETGRDRALPAPRKGGGRPLMQALADRINAKTWQAVPEVWTRNFMQLTPIQKVVFSFQANTHFLPVCFLYAL